MDPAGKRERRLGRLAVAGALAGAVLCCAAARAAAPEDCNSDDPDTMIAGCSAVLQAETDPAIRVAALVRRGAAHKDKSEFEAAVADLSDALRLAPRMAEVLVLRGETYASMGQPKPAASDFAAALQIDPKNAEALAGMKHLSATAAIEGKSASGPIAPPAGAVAQQGSAAPAATRDLVLFDELVRMRQARGAISAGTADELLRLEAVVLTQRGTSDKVHRGMVAAEQREANTFFLYVEHVVATSPHWPTDLPAQQYRAQADGLMSGVRPNHAQAMASDQDPVESLVTAYRVLRLASGDKNMLLAQTPFEARASEVAGALTAAHEALAAPTQVAAAGSGTRPPPPAPALGAGPAAPKPAPASAGLSAVAQAFRKAGLLGTWATACGDPPSPANPHAKRYIAPSGAVMQVNETGPSQVAQTYEFKTAELRPDGKLAATLEAPSTHKLETIVYRLDPPSHSGPVNAYHVWYRQNGDGVVLVREGTGTITHQPLPAMHRCAG